MMANQTASKTYTKKRETERRKCEVELATSGKLALSEIRLRTPTCIVMKAQAEALPSEPVIH
jgi:hypothetical protein